MESLREDVLWWHVLAAVALGLIVQVLLLLRWLLAHRRVDSVLDWGGRLDVISKKIDALENLVKKSQKIDSEEDKTPKKSDNWPHNMANCLNTVLQNSIVSSGHVSIKSDTHASMETNVHVSMETDDHASVKIMSIH